MTQNEHSRKMFDEKRNSSKEKKKKDEFRGVKGSETGFV